MDLRDQELADLKAGRTSHTHVPRSGADPFRCTSPYCDDLGLDEPMGPPPLYADAPRYRREIDA